jgi:hypothetical protein
MIHFTFSSFDVVKFAPARFDQRRALGKEISHLGVGEHEVWTGDYNKPCPQGWAAFVSKANPA